MRIINCLKWRGLRMQCTQRTNRRTAPLRSQGRRIISYHLRGNSQARRCEKVREGAFRIVMVLSKRFIFCILLTITSTLTLNE